MLPKSFGNRQPNKIGRLRIRLKAITGFKTRKRNHSSNHKQTIDSDSFVKGVPTEGESPKVDKPRSPLAGKPALKSLKPPSPESAQGPSGVVDTPTSPSRATLSHDATNISPTLEATETPEVFPPSPRSYGLGAPGGPPTDEGSSVTSSRTQPRPFLCVAESSWTIWTSSRPDFTSIGMLRLP
jgi:hypothetical protein